MHFPLHPDTPDEGRTLQDMFQCGPDEIQEKNNRMRSLMAAENLPYNDRSHTYKSRLTQELGKWAEETQLNANTFHMAAYQAYFVDNRNIGDPKVLLDLVETFGLDVVSAKNVLDKRTYKDKIDADWNKSREYGITGVPTFLIGGKGCGGAQPYEVLANMLDTVGVKKKIY